MLTFIDEFVGTPVMGLRGGRRLTTTLEPIIDPHKLTVAGFYVDDRASGLDKVLLVEDIREFSDIGIVVDSEDVFMDASDLVRLEGILEMQFEIVNKRLVTQSGKKLGQVEDYAIDSSTFRVEKIYARPVAIRTLSTNDYIVGRRQIASVSEDEIVVKDAVVKGGNRARKPSLNPLRS